jgi:hypothetical protein
MTEYFGEENLNIKKEELKSLEETIDNEEKVEEKVVEKAVEKVVEKVEEKAVEKAVEKVEEKAVEKVEEKAVEKVEHIFKIKLNIQNVLLGILTTSSILLLLINFHPIVLIHILICIIILGLGCLYVVDSTLTIRILETGLLYIPILFQNTIHF